MSKLHSVAWRWLFAQPALGTFDIVQSPVDFARQTLINKLWSQGIDGPVLEAIRQRSLVYRKSGCPLMACVKSAVRDLLKEAE